MESSRRRPAIVVLTPFDPVGSIANNGDGALCNTMQLLIVQQVSAVVGWSPNRVRKLHTD